MISRQLEPSMSSVVQTQSLQSSEPTPSMSGMSTLGRRRVALGVVPDEQLAVLLHRRPGAGACPQRNALGVRDADAASLARPAPVVERARDRVVLDRALGEVAAHVPAVGVEHAQRAVRGREDDELGAERGDRVRLAVAEVGGQAEAVPARARSDPARRRRRWNARRRSPALVSTVSGHRRLLSLVLNRMRTRYRNRA